MSPDPTWGGRICWGTDCISLGKIGPLLVPATPVATGVGVGETPPRVYGRHKVCGEESEGWEKPEQAPG